VLESWGAGIVPRERQRDERIIASGLEDRIVVVKVQPDQDAVDSRFRRIGPAVLVVITPDQVAEGGLTLRTGRTGSAA
jgi:hypothetical protein